MARWEAAEGTVLQCTLPAIGFFPNEQNRTGRRLAIVARSAIEWRIIKEYLPQIAAAVDSAAAGSFQAVDCGTFQPQESRCGVERHAVGATVVCATAAASMAASRVGPRTWRSDEVDITLSLSEVA